MLSISLNSEENKMRVRASYKHSAATRLFSRQNSEAGGGNGFVRGEIFYEQPEQTASKHPGVSQ